MADKTGIEWTDATWNITTGCDVVSPGCTNCYAMRLAGTRLKHHPSRAGLTRDTKAGPVWNGAVKINWEWIDQPLQWAKPRNIFVCAHGDLFHEIISKDELATIYAVMIAAHHLRGHTLQVLTKRADRMCAVLNDEEFWEQVNAEASGNVLERVDALNRRSDDARATMDAYGPDNPPPGIWHSVSCEDQKRADERVPYLLRTPSIIRGVSAEPLLGPIDFSRVSAIAEGLRVRPLPLIVEHVGQGPHLGPHIDWIIVGGESGPNARPMHPDWARSIRDQCEAVGVPFFFKQWGEWNTRGFARAIGVIAHPFEPINGKNIIAPWGNEDVIMARVGKKRAGRLLDGVEHNEFPRIAA